MKVLIILSLLATVLCGWGDLCQKDSDCKTGECCVRDTEAWKNTPGSPARNVCLKQLKLDNLCANSKCLCEQGTSCNAEYTNYGIVTKCMKEVRTLPRNDTCLGDADCPGKQCCVWDVTLKQKGNICLDKIQENGACGNTKCPCQDDLDCMSFDETTQVETKCSPPR